MIPFALSSLERGVEREHGVGGQGEGRVVSRGLGERRPRRRKRKRKGLDDDHDGGLFFFPSSCASSSSSSSLLVSRRRQQLAAPQGGSPALFEGLNDLERGQGPSENDLEREKKEGFCFEKKVPPRSRERAEKKKDGFLFLLASLSFSLS